MLQVPGVKPPSRHSHCAVFLNGRSLVRVLTYLVCATVDVAWLPAPGHLIQADRGLLAAQVVFGGAGAAGILGDLWIFDVFTRYGSREALPPQHEHEQQLRVPQAHEHLGCTVDPVDAACCRIWTHPKTSGAPATPREMHSGTMVSDTQMLVFGGRSATGQVTKRLGSAGQQSSGGRLGQKLCIQ